MSSVKRKFSEDCSMTLPSGDTLRVLVEDQGEYPGISIWLQHSNCELPEEMLSIVEFNRDHAPGMELCIGAYCSGEDEPAYYKSYAGQEGVI